MVWLPKCQNIYIIITFAFSNGIFFIIFERFGLYTNAKITFTHEFETFTVYHFNKVSSFINLR